MRLLNSETFELEEFEGQSVPSYAILSHRWQADEVSFKDIERGQATQKTGWHKILRCCEQARRATLPYVWVDTCCIDKSSSAELSEAINSMFKWYEESIVCYVYLFDVDISSTTCCDDAAAEQSSGVDSLRFDKDFLFQFYASVWFTRGWTLQELLAPSNVEFFNADWYYLANKQALCGAITIATSIPAAALLYERKLSAFTVAERMSWASRRSTTRTEDIAYSLMGVFGINMPLLYGEREAAFIRLQEEILKRSNDESILLWQADRLGLLATSPAAFAIHLPDIPEETRTVVFTSQPYPTGSELWCHFRKDRQPSSLTNVGLSIELELVPWYIDIYLAKLQIRKVVRKTRRTYDACIFVKQTVNDARLSRVQFDGEGVKFIESVLQASRDSFRYDAASLFARHLIAQDNWDTSAGKGHVKTWDVTQQRYGFKFSFESNECWGASGTLEAEDVLSRQRWDPRERTLDLSVGLREVAAIIRARKSADEWCYMYLGFTPDFVPTIVQKDWHIKSLFKSFDEFIKDVATSLLSWKKRSPMITSWKPLDVKIRPRNWSFKAVIIPTK